MKTRQVARWPALVPMLAATMILGLAGCEQKTGGPPPGKPAEVLVSVPLVREVTDYEDFTGRTEATKVVDVRSHKTGYLDQIHFKDGDFVKEGELLFEIDPRPFQTELRRMEASLGQMKARLQRLDADYQRALTLFPQKVMSKEEFDRIIGDRLEADAAVKVAEANVDTAKINLGYTKIKARVSGIASYRLKDPGNLIKEDDTLLTTIVKVDPMNAVFDVDERTVQRMRRMLDPKVPIEQQKLPVLLAFADEEEFKHKGTIDFVDNRVDPGTGTQRWRAEFANPRHTFLPGLFVRVRLQIGAPHKALLIADRALASDQGQKYLYVINDKNEAEYRHVKIGPVHQGMRVIDTGLKEGERIVVAGLQRVRPGAKVQPKLVDMPVARDAGK